MNKEPQVGRLSKEEGIAYRCVGKEQGGILEQEGLNDSCKHSRGENKEQDN